MDGREIAVRRLHWVCYKFSAQIYLLYKWVHGLSRAGLCIRVYNNMYLHMYEGRCRTWAMQTVKRLSGLDVIAGSTERGLKYTCSTKAPLQRLLSSMRSFTSSFKSLANEGHKSNAHGCFPCIVNAPQSSHVVQF